MLLGLLFLLSKGGSTPRAFPATPPGAPTNDGRDWFAIWDGDDWGASKLETLSSANTRWRAVKESSGKGTELYRYSFPFKRWLKVA